MADPAPIDLTLFDLDNMDRVDFDSCDSNLSTFFLPSLTSTIEPPADSILQASDQSPVDTQAVTLPSSVETESAMSLASPTTVPTTQALKRTLTVSTLSISSMAPTSDCQEQSQPLGTLHPEGTNASLVGTSLSSSEVQTIVRQVSLTSATDSVSADIHSFSGPLYSPTSPSPIRAGHGPGDHCDPHGGFSPTSPTGLLYSQQHGPHLQTQQRQPTQQTLLPHVQSHAQPQVQPQYRRNPQMHPLSILRLQQQQHQQNQAHMVNHTDFGHTATNKPQLSRHPQLLPHQLPQQASHHAGTLLSFPPLAPQPYPLHPHPHPHPHPYSSSQVFPQSSPQMVQQHQELWSRQAQYHHQYQQQQQQPRHLPPFPYPHPLADAPFHAMVPHASLNANQYLPPLPPQQVFQSNQGQAQMDYFTDSLSASMSINGHRDPQLMSSLHQQQLQTTFLGPLASSLSSSVSSTSSPGLTTSFHGYPCQYHNQRMLGSRVLISDSNPSAAITFGDQPHHPQFISYEGSPATTGDEQQDRDLEVHTPASGTQYVRTMKAEELAERLRQVREQKHKSSPPKPAPRQRRRPAQKQKQKQMETPEDDQDRDVAPIKLSDSPLLAAQARILQTLTKITAESAESSSLQFSASQIPSPSTTPQSGTSERSLTAGGVSLLKPLQGQAGTSDESGDMRYPTGDTETENESTISAEDSFGHENYEVQRVYHELHVSLHDIEGTGEHHGGHRAPAAPAYRPSSTAVTSSHPHDSYSSSSSSLGDESRTASPELDQDNPKVKMEENVANHASKTLPRIPAYSRGADYGEISGPVRVRRPKRSLAELYENGRRRSLGYSDDPEKDDVDIEGLAEAHSIPGEQLKTVHEYGQEDTESGGEADDSSSDYSEKGSGPRRSRRQVKRGRASEKAVARSSGAALGLGIRKAHDQVLSGREKVRGKSSGIATGIKGQNRRQNHKRPQGQSFQLSKAAQLPTAAVVGPSSRTSSMPLLHEEYTREMQNQVLRAQALIKGTYTLPGFSGGSVADANPAGTSRDHANQHQSMDRQQGSNDHGGSSGDIPCTFPSCPRSFISQGLLKSHLVSHFEDKPFWCDECSEDGVHPRPSLPPLMPGMPPQVFEVKRYKRNHDLLRHKREQHPPVSVQISRALEKIAARDRRKEATQRKSRERTEEKKKEEEEEGQEKSSRKRGQGYDDESKELLKKIEASARAIETLESNQKAKRRRQSEDQQKKEDEEENGGAAGEAMPPQTPRRARKGKKE
ncbi:hypothetical protein EMPS_10573 [Entomortierella parvispora]|uniref:C2H2-type domain-containing protein n=1 Tax=Entomortierella parvispora TaxID=205924 RepID=A0A9P3HK23_9FUNG|nr:hypothetical protein EMPS_10573 [Entomortierella parvispora]